MAEFIDEPDSSGSVDEVSSTDGSSDGIWDGSSILFLGVSDGAIDSFDVDPSGVANDIFVDSNVTGIDMSSERSIPGRVLDGSKDSSVVFTYGTSLACKKASVSTSPAVIHMVHGFSCH